MITDTIAAISTAIGQSAISIVRLSGDEAIDIVSKIFRGPNLSKANSHTIHYGHIMDQDTIIDEVLISLFKSPKSFTTEDIVEIHCHGGAYVASRILELVLSHGARPAEPGEFTQRAFLHGRIDLTQAEAVMDVIAASSELSLSLANKGLSGEVRKLIESLQNELMQIIAQIEVNIDYPEYDDVETLTNELLLPKTKKLISKTQEIIKQSYYGQIIRDGVKTAIIGRPNVGKSSILNALLKEEKAIVTEIQGTTRDIVEGRINLGGIVLHLIDTAGIRQSSDKVEQIGIEKAKQVIREAELILFILDNNQSLNKVDKELLEMTNEKNRIIVVNKVDLSKKLNHSFSDVVEVSALHKSGINKLEERIRSMFLQTNVNSQNQTYLSNARHIAKMREAKQALLEAVQGMENLLPVDMIEIDLKQAWTHLAEITGTNTTDSLLDELFSKFCLGK
jgi:tRNA modification GTPase